MFAHITRRLSLGVALASMLTTNAAWSAGPTTSSALATAGTWTIALDRSGATCRVLLRGERADSGDYFLGMPAACRHAMPGLETVSRWARPDADHIALDNPSGKAILVLAAAPGGTFSARTAEGDYVLTPSGAGAASLATVDTRAPGFATVEPVSTRHVAEAEAGETPGELAGRYAVMREKRDTGCMVTLDDKTRVKGGVRAQLAPGCRDQGIVIFDPSAWALVKGKLVLTARAGHKAVLDRIQDGLWAKDVKDGSKPLGLKKL